VKKLKAIRCTARRTNGEPCKHWAIRGGTVCYTHGGAAPQVKAAAKQRLLDLIDQDRWREEISALALHKVPDIFDADGNMLPMKDWPEECKRAVSSVEVVKRNLTSGDGATDMILKVRFNSKSEALKMAGTNLGMLKETVAHEGGITVKWED
jgi:hypothetical protein